ncbi:hypothetical protein TRFO_27131 [Tritrichomonas foetus]|uniref:Inner centromere protein ARK-binding domain-containing protein n=1 Tax=Tritrichomonas foetus TaxID=1144522 RepID=A0A1J4K6V7_9EUKA|nr:hypothetical protein TRFO_27131 [Tritrichomonas foetus]|eukprot:OHT05197.1 hypothetical protein TRFO_27131 [Tritrichomonas foetus]
MTTIKETCSRLNQLLSKETKSFELSQRMQYEWLQSIKVQLDIFTDSDLNSSSSIQRLSFDDPNPFMNQEDSNEPNNPRRMFDENQPPTDDENQYLDQPKKIVVNNIVNSSNEYIMNSGNDSFNEDESESSTLNIPMSGNRSATSPCFTNTIRFVDDNSLLDSSDSSDESTDLEIDGGVPVPYTVSGSMSELTQTASSFREKWMEMIHQKKAATNLPKKPFKFAFEEEEIAPPEGYKISDDSDDEPEDDEEIYERNPVEIHGKMIPTWARGDQLLKQLKRQQRIDPDSIFSGFTADCYLPDVFNAHKERWDQRHDSGWWDADRVTEEEVAQFKRALGLQ